MAHYDEPLVGNQHGNVDNADLTESSLCKYNFPDGRRGHERHWAVTRPRCPVQDLAGAFTRQPPLRC